MRKAAFLDRDGVINADHGYVFEPENFEWLPGVFEACRELVRLGYDLVVVTNQSGIARGYYSEDDFQRLTEWMKATFEREGAPLSGVYFCPHHPDKGLGAYRLACNCRKPEPGMLLTAARDLSIDLTKSVMFGDKPGDMTAARRAGVSLRIQVGTDGQALPAPCPNATHCALNLFEGVQLLSTLTRTAHHETRS